MKNLYKGLFNYQSRSYIEYVYAYTSDQAKFTIMRRIAKKQGVPLSWVCNHFNGEKDNYKIILEMEFEEAT